MKNQSGTIKTNPELYRVVMGGSGGYRRLPGRSDHFSLQTHRHCIIIYISSDDHGGAPVHIELCRAGHRSSLPGSTSLLNSSTSRKRLRSDLKTWHVLAHWNTCLLSFYWNGNYVYQIMALGAFCTADASLIVFLIGPEKSRPFTMAFHATIGWYAYEVIFIAMNCRYQVNELVIIAKKDPFQIW